MSQFKIIFTLAAFILSFLTHAETQIFTGKLIKNIQTNTASGKYLGILTEVDNTPYVLKFSHLPPKNRALIKRLKNQLIKVEGTVTQNNSSPFMPKTIRVKQFMIVEDSTLEDSFTIIGKLKKPIHDKPYFMLATVDQFYRFTVRGPRVERILYNYLDKVIKIVASHKQIFIENLCLWDIEQEEYLDDDGAICNPEHFTESQNANAGPGSTTKVDKGDCIWEDYHQDYVNDFAEKCIPDMSNYMKILFKTSEEVNLKSITLPTRYTNATGNIKRIYTNGGNIFPLNRKINEQEIKTNTWLSVFDSEDYTNKYDGRNLNIFGPVLEYNGQNVIHAETIKVLD